MAFIKALYKEIAAFAQWLPLEKLENWTKCIKHWFSDIGQ